MPSTTSIAAWQHTHVFDEGNPLAARNTRWAVLLTVAMMVAEIAGGYLFNSMALLADGWHMSSHAVALGVSVLAYGAARRMLQGDELELKNARNYGGPDFTAAAGNRLHQHFGLLIASCEGADLRPLPSGVMIYANEARRLEPLPAPKVQRAEVIDELYGAIVEGKPPRHDGNWGAATLEVCLAILRSSREGREIALPAPTASRT